MFRFWIVDFKRDVLLCCVLRICDDVDPVIWIGFVSFLRLLGIGV